jgi:hypothetical protein
MTTPDPRTPDDEPPDDEVEPEPASPPDTGLGTNKDPISGEQV